MDNPFSALVGATPSSESADESNITPLVETVFLFTLKKQKESRLLYLEEIANSLAIEEFNIETLEHALFERLLLTNVAAPTSNRSEDVICTKAIVYLYNCFKRNVLQKGNELKAIIEELVLRNVVTALKQPDLYEQQDLFEQMYDLLKGSDSETRNFFIETFKAFEKEEDGLISMKEPFKMILKVAHMDIAKSNPLTFPYYVFNVLNLYTTNKDLAMIMLEYNQPIRKAVGMEYSNTLFGSLFCVSVLPKTAIGTYEFFTEGLNAAVISNIEGMLWTRSTKVTKDMQNLILNLLKCNSDVKAQTLTWIGDCLKANEDRGKLWNAHAPHLNLPDTNTVSHGFMINLGKLLVKLCQPFCENIGDGKILKVDPTYCAVPNAEHSAKGIHLLDMSKETCLVPIVDPNELRITASTYSFVTETFFMAHRAFDIGFRVLSEKLVQLNQEMGRIERAYHEAQIAGTSEAFRAIKQRMESELNRYLSTKCAMSEPTFLRELFTFLSASAYWLNNVAVNDIQHSSATTTFAPLNDCPITFPLSDRIPDTLKCIPEFVIENIVCYLIFLRRFSPQMFEEQGCDNLKPLLTFILVYMGSAGYTKNPHLRAHLAEALEALLPFHKDQAAALHLPNRTQRQLLFKSHAHRKEIVTVLLDVFVSIEMTGQSVQFEQKFNYRRPMYTVMDYLWESGEYKQYFRKLAQDAEANMDAVSPPIFLRFINLLINDAIFLLDESLTNMAKLKEMEIARERGDWDTLPAQERAQTLAQFQHTGMTARFDNILGRDTIRTLENLTSCITIVFTHNTMVDRVAAMLNYFLLKLVGPDKKNFKVKDQKEYRFNPAKTVLAICKIYVNLKESDSFCLAVSQDGRSYSPQLFTLAEDVLVRIGGGHFLGELQEVAKKVSEKAAEYKSSEESMAEVPDHFLDPIMSTLMMDPVILPSSRQIVDRSTIARHLLSNQTDPFNRAPLSMDQLIPNTELALEIQQWLEERKTKT